MKIIIIFLISILLTGCNNDKVYEVKEQNYFIQTMDYVEVYSDVYLNDIIEKNADENVKILSNNYLIDTKELGKKEYEIMYEIDKKKYVYKFEVEVKDTEGPIVFSGTNKTVNLNYTGDLCNLITYGDNYDGTIDCVIDGDYDLENPGTYKLKYSLSDSSNNKKEVNVTLNVVRPSSGGNSGGGTTEAKKTYFTDIYDKHKRNNTEIGIDVSKWQGNIDFEKVKNAGAGFVMIRIGVEGSKTKKVSIDEYFKQNIQNAKAAGLKVGVYLYSIATNTEEAREHAKWVIDTLEGEKLDLPIVFDWENWSNWNSYKISFYEINSVANTFMETVKENGYEGMLYSSKFYLETIWTNKFNYPVWLAHYTDKTNYTGKYQIWQLCNNGQIDGINGDVDIDVMYI